MNRCIDCDKDIYKGSKRCRPCWSKQNIGENNHRYKHGFQVAKEDKFYAHFTGMRSRVRSNNKYYKDIGCEWRDFMEFKNDMYESYLEFIKDRPATDATLDRIDGNKNYCKNNCRWADRKTQSLNRRNIKMITFNGKTQNLNEWSRELGIPISTLYTRIYNKKWKIEDAFNTIRLKNQFDKSINPQ